MPEYLIVICIFLAAAAVAGLIYLIACMVVGRLLLNMVLHPNRRSYEYSREGDSSMGFADAFKDYDEKWERHDFEITTADGLKLFGEYVPNPACTGRAKLALIVHGQTVSRMTSLKYARVFYNLGWNIMFYDHRYFGKSDGKYSTLGYKESDDLILVLRKAKEIFGKDCEICLHGESMGSATTLLTLAKPESDSLVDFAVVDCPFADSHRLFMEICSNRFHVGGKPFLRFSTLFAKRYGYDLMNSNPINGAKRTEKPILFIHGDNDKLINYKHSVDMAAVCKNPLSRCELFAGAEHARSYSVDKPRYEALIKEFCEQAES